MSTDTGPSKALIIGGIIIFVVVVGLILFYVFDATSPNDSEPVEPPFAFPASPPDNQFSEPVIQVVTEPDPVNAPRQQNNNDQVRSVFEPVGEDEPVADEAELDALAYLNSRPVSAKDVAEKKGSDVRDRGPSYEEIMAKIEANPDSLFSSQQSADYFGDWTPAQTTDDFMDQVFTQDWSLESRVGMATVTSNMSGREIFDIDISDYKSCGEINVDTAVATSESQLSSAFSGDTSAICLGREMIDECSPTIVVNAGLSYLTGDFGNGCAVGIMNGGFANLCTIQPDPVSLSSSLSNNEIGDLIADIFINTSITECELYRY
jgi:hypothetical protein